MELARYRSSEEFMSFVRLDVTARGAANGRNEEEEIFNEAEGAMQRVRRMEGRTKKMRCLMKKMGYK